MKKKELKRLLEIANETIDGQKEVITANSGTIEALEIDRDAIHKIMGNAIKERDEGEIIISFLSMEAKNYLAHSVAPAPVHSRMTRRLSSSAIKNLAILNMASGILQVRSHKDILLESVCITSDKKVLNRNRKLLKTIQTKLDHICKVTYYISKSISHADIERLRKENKVSILKDIDYKNSNAEILALNLLYICFNDDIDFKVDEIFKSILKIDYMDIIIPLSEDIGLEKDVSDDMYISAQRIIDEIKK